MGLLTLSQIVQTTKTDTFSSAAAAWTDITGLSLNITPAATTSDILVRGCISAGTAGSGQPVYFRVLRDATPIHVGDAAGSRLQVSGAVGHHFDGQPTNWFFEYLDSPSTTSAVTYKVQMYTQGGTTWINRTTTDTDSAQFGRSTSTLTAIEITV